MIFGTLAWTIELCMKNYIIGEIFSSGGTTLHKNPSDQTVREKNPRRKKIRQVGISKKMFLQKYVLVRIESIILKE